MKRFQLSLWVCLVVCFGFSTYAQDTKEIIILQTSDVHSRIEPINQKGDRNYDEGGFVRRATFLDQFRKEHKNVLLFDCGDISQGTPYYNMFRGEVEVKLMNEMGYDAMTIGNHEFDFDLDNMALLFKMAKCSWFTSLQNHIHSYHLTVRKTLNNLCFITTGSTRRHPTRLQFVTGFDPHLTFAGHSRFSIRLERDP